MNVFQAQAEARRNPQAFACMGLVMFSGLLGVFTAFFATTLPIRTSIPAFCLALFVVGIMGHNRFKKQERLGALRSSRGTRRLIGYGFLSSTVIALVFAGWLIIERDWFGVLLPVGYAICILPFAKNILKDEVKPA